MSRDERPPTRWSKCSKDRLQRTFNDDMDYCLHNIPRTIYGDTPECGNGIVDQGEDCDCGNVPSSVRLVKAHRTLLIAVSVAVRSRLQWVTLTFDLAFRSANR